MISLPRKCFHDQVRGLLSRIEYHRCRYVWDEGVTRLLLPRQRQVLKVGLHLPTLTTSEVGEGGNLQLVAVTMRNEVLDEDVQVGLDTSHCINGEQDGGFKVHETSVLD